MTDRNRAPIVRVWLLTNDATPDAIPPILILAQRPEPEVDVRTGLLQALDLFTAPQDAAGHA